MSTDRNHNYHVTEEIPRSFGCSSSFYNKIVTLSAGPDLVTNRIRHFESLNGERNYPVISCAPPPRFSIVLAVCVWSRTAGYVVQWVSGLNDAERPGVPTDVTLLD